jgi:7,8-didemethyl-8-hydroxy-5-deazariboflavin synthase CofH subunit
MMFGLAASRETVDAILSRVTTPVGTALTRVLEGKAPGYDDGLALASARGGDLDALILVADYLRRQVNGDRVTYVINRNINFTNVCNVGCKFCAFSVGPRNQKGWRTDLEVVATKAREAWSAGAHEVCIQGGINPEDSPYVYRDVIRAVKGAVPGMHVHAFSPLEILVGSQRTGMNFRDYLSMLKDEGLDTIPGTGAEILDDEIRRQISPVKLPTDTWAEIVRTAHSLGIRSSSTMMYGHIEEPRHWVNHILLLRRIQQETGGFTEFVPLGFVHYNTRLYKYGNARPGPTLEEDLRAHAFGRVMLHGLIDHIQVSWVKLGHKLALMCLQAGADDYGGTLMEESISRMAGATAGEVVWPHEIRRMVRSIDRVPALRNTIYTRVVVDHGPEEQAGEREAMTTDLDFETEFDPELTLPVVSATDE